jgi:putative ABC transport system permease protein
MAVVVAALILAATASVGRLFLAAAGDAALAQELREAGGVPALAIVVFSSFEPDTVGSIDASARSVVRVQGPGLGPAVRTMLGPSIRAAAGGRVTSVQLAARDGFAAHVHPLARTSGQGVWMPDTAARLLGLRPGKALKLGAGPGVEVRVAGVYQDLARTDGPLDPFWSPLSSVIYTANAERSSAAPLLLVDPDRLAELGPALDLHGRLEWDFYPGPGPLTLPRSQALAAEIQQVESAVGDPPGPLGKLQATTSSSLAQLVDRARTTMATLTGPVEAISLAGRLLALALVAAAGVYGVRRRRTEVLVLTAQGIGGARIGARSMVEAALAVALGGTLGWALAIALAGVLNPSPVLQLQAVAAARREVVAILAGGLVLYGATTWAAVRSEELERTGRLRQVLVKPWWEALVLVVAAAALYELHTRGVGPVLTEGGPPQIDRLVVLFPMLFIAGLAGLATRWVARLLGHRGLRAAGQRRRPAPLLALRRLAAAPRLVLLLVTGSTVALGMLTYAEILVASTQAAAIDKARILVGSDTNVTVQDATPLQGGTGLRTTIVDRLDGATLPGGEPVDLLAVDPATFVGAAFWDASFAPAPLSELLRRLDTPPKGRLAAILAGPTQPQPAALEVQATRLPLAVVGTAAAFPGMTSSDRPLLVVSAAQLEAMAKRAGTEPGFRFQVWAREDPAAVLAVLRRAGVVPEATSTAHQAMRSPAFVAVSWTFLLLQALGVLAGLVALAGLVLYGQARQRGRVVANALVRRMGLSRAAHRRSVALELAGMLLFAFALGGILALLAAALVYRRLDPMPGIPPPLSLHLPGTMLAGTLLGVALAAWTGAWLVQRAADRANVAEVMRLAG